MKTLTFDEMMIQSLRKDPAYAVDLLNALLQEGAEEELRIMLRHLCKAFGGVHAVAAQAQLNGSSLYRALSAQGNPQVSTLSAVLRTLGLRLAVQPLAKTHQEKTPQEMPA